MAKGKEAAPVAAAASAPRDGPVIVGVVAEEGAKASTSPALLKLHLAAKLAAKDLPVDSRTLPAAGAAFGSSGASLGRVLLALFEGYRLILLRTTLHVQPSSMCRIACQFSMHMLRCDICLPERSLIPPSWALWIAGPTLRAARFNPRWHRAELG